MMHAETVLQNHIRVALSQYGVVFRQNSGLFTNSIGERVRIGAPGMSDLLYIGAPYTEQAPTTAWLEIKTGSGRPTREQLAFIDAMKSIGCKAGIVRSVEDAIEIIGVRTMEGERE